MSAAMCLESERACGCGVLVTRAWSEGEEEGCVPRMIMSDIFGG